MTKKSLFFGGLALLVLLVFAGCSNPSGDTEYVDRSPSTGFDYPAGTVFTDDFYELDGLLNPTDQPTNGVRNIAFYGEGLEFAAELRIPKGKTVYIQDTGDDPIELEDYNIIVEEGGVLVLVSALQTSASGKLLVKGSVDVYGVLIATQGALDVADYHEDGGTVNSDYTVIGKKVSVKAGGWLVLQSGDIRLADDSSENKFFPAEAWAAAGQGSLAIAGTPLSSAFSVAYLLGISPSPSATRRYQVSTAGGGKLPAVIPVGASITATGEIADAEGDALTVNGTLIAAAASFKNIKTLTVNGTLTAATGTFENVETLTVSTVETQDYTRAVANGGVPASVQGGTLTANGATLQKAKTITINDNGVFSSLSTMIDLPAEAEIFLGAGAIFDAGATTGNTFGEVVRLFIGPAARVDLASKSVSLAKLKYLTLRDGGSLKSAGEFAFELAEPAVQGKQSLITGKYAAGAKVDLQVNGDILIDDEVAYTVTETSTLTIAEGKVLTVPSGGVLDLSAIKLPLAAAGTAPITVNGTIKVEEGGKIIGTDISAITTDKPAQVYAAFSFGPNGKLVFDWGADYTMGKDDNETLIVGASTVDSDYKWVADDTDGARIEISGSGVTIRDTNGGNDAVVTIGGDNAYILKGQSLYLDTGVTLAVAAKPLVLVGDTATGAKLLGPGSLIINGVTTIKGGANGWQAAGGGNITFALDTSSSKIGASAASSTLTAMGAGATIVQAVDETKTLTIASEVAVNLAGTTTSPGGSITLTAGANGGSLILVGKILAGAGTGAAITTADVDTFTIDNAAMTLGASITKANFFVDASNFLNQIQGAQATNTITAGATDNVIIRSTAKVGATKAD